MKGKENSIWGPREALLVLCFSVLGNYIDAVEPIVTEEKEIVIVESDPEAEKRKEILERLNELQAKHRVYLGMKDNKEKAKIMTVEDIHEMRRLYGYYYAEAAKKVSKEESIPASIMLAQGILESGAGSSYLFSGTKNHFCIKCSKHSQSMYKGQDFDGCCKNHYDDNAYDHFKTFETDEECFRYYVGLLKKDRYKKCFECPSGDYKCWAYELKAAGYATDPEYVRKLISLVEKYNLDKYDEEGEVDSDLYVMKDMKKL